MTCFDKINATPVYGRGSGCSVLRRAAKMVETYAFDTAQGCPAEVIEHLLKIAAEIDATASALDRLAESHDDEHDEVFQYDAFPGRG